MRAVVGPHKWRDWVERGYDSLDSDELVAIVAVKDANVVIFAGSCEALATRRKLDSANIIVMFERANDALTCRNVPNVHFTRPRRKPGRVGLDVDGGYRPPALHLGRFFLRGCVPHAGAPLSWARRQLRIAHVALHMLRLGANRLSLSSKIVCPGGRHLKSISRASIQRATNRHIDQHLENAMVLGPIRASLIQIPVSRLPTYEQ